MSEVSVSQSGEVETNAQGIPIVHVTIPNQPVQVQSVIQSNQPSVIHTAGPNVQTIQVATVEEDLSDDPDGKKRREILARRPSYRKILNELSSDTPAIPGVAKIEEESNSSQSQDGGETSEAATNLGAGDTVRYQSSPVIPGTIQITTHPDGTLVTQGLQTLTMTNAVNSSPGSTAGATIVQYAQGPDGQFYIPVESATTQLPAADSMRLHTFGGTNVQAYQIATSGALPQGVVMTTTGGAIANQQQLSEEASRKRELRLLKNRDAARECRRKKKDYVKCLENRVAVLENQNKTLIEELKALKELYCQKEG